MDMEKSETSPAPKRRWRKAAAATSVIGGILLSAVTVLPVAVLNSSHRNEILSAEAAKYGLTASAESASGSWVTPIVLHNVVLEDETGRVRCVIDEVRTSRTITGLLFNGGDLGTFTLDHPAISIAMDEEGNLPPGLFPEQLEEDSDTAKPAFAVEALNTEIVLSVPWRPVPIVELGGLDAYAAVTNEEDGRWLEVSPVQVFDHALISEEDTEQNLALVAPVLTQTTGVSGEMSVVLDGARMQLDAEEAGPIPLSGQVTFHAVEARLKEQWVRQMGQLLGRVVGARLPDRLQIVRNSAVRFFVDQRGIHHQGLAFVLPDLAQGMNIQSAGMVGLDETLDLALNVQLPLLRNSNAFLSAINRVTSLPFQLKVTGTVDAPKLETPPGMSVVDKMSRNTNPTQHTNDPPPVTDSVIRMIGSASSGNSDEAVSGVVGGVLNIIRSAKAARENAPPKPPKPPRVKKPRKRDRRRNRI